MKLKVILLFVSLLVFSGCATISKVDVKNDKELYSALKAMAEQHNASRALKLGCSAGWGGLNILPAPSSANPIVVNSLDALKNLISTQSTTVMISDLKERTEGWSEKDYNLGYTLCEEAKLSLMLGIGDAQAITNFVLTIMAMFPK